MTISAFAPGMLGEQLERDGYAMLAGALNGTRVAEYLADLTLAMETQSDKDGAIRGGGSPISAARNLLHLWPRALDLAREPALRRAIVTTLGPGCGLVRGLFFDKPPGQSWALPWHKDLTIAVQNNRLPSSVFVRPTTKAGIPHVEAPEQVLRAMLTARIHFDDVTDENGPLLLAPGSHRYGKRLTANAADARICSIQAVAGDVLLMRPLVTHSSGYAHAETRRHRRVVHLEFAPAAPLPDGYSWHDFWPLDAER
jgi:hypothetical protein